MTFRIVEGVPWVGEKEYPWATAVMHCPARTGFHLQLENGYTISCQFGKFAYCQNYIIYKNVDAWDAMEVVDGSPDAEIAILNANQSFAVTFAENSDCVMGYVTPEQFNALVAEVAQWDSNQDNMVITTIRKELIH